MLKKLSSKDDAKSKIGGDKMQARHDHPAN